MKIKLDNTWMITGDAMNYILSKWEMRDKKGKEVLHLSQSTFYNTLENTLKAYKEKSIRTSDAETIKEVLEVVKRVDKVIEDKLEGI